MADTLYENDEGAIPPGFCVTRAGVFFLEKEDGDDGEEKINRHWICAPLHVRALVRDPASDNWGRMLEWLDPDGKLHSWVMPMQLLRSDGTDVRGELLRLGHNVSTGYQARQKLMEYIAGAKPMLRALSVPRTGWYGSAFVLPNQTVGETSERILLQTDAVAQAYSQAGSLDDWKSGVARLCVGNSRLMLGVSTAFAAMLLELSGQESHGFNIVGPSSTGKTTILRAASSVFGGTDYLQRWRATTNGLEGLAYQHNDTLLVLDELAQVDAREAGETAYLLANGTGKVRAARLGQALSRKTWKLIFLSAGEIGLSQHMMSAGKKSKAGQEVRLIEITADAGAGLGIFQELHGQPGGAELSTVINEAAAKFHGTPAIAFIEAICKSQMKIRSWLQDETELFAKTHLPAKASGQAHRVCKRFALVGLAGELATKCGITGWNAGNALQAAAECFSVWLNERGGAQNLEKDAILSQVKAFFEAHEESRFVDLNVASERPIINRAGFRRSLNAGGVEYLVLPEVFKREICIGLEPKTVARTLIEAGWIRPAFNGWSQRTERLPSKGGTKVYVFTSNIWGITNE